LIQENPYKKNVTVKIKNIIYLVRKNVDNVN